MTNSPCLRPNSAHQAPRQDRPVDHLGRCRSILIALFVGVVHSGFAQRPTVVGGTFAPAAQVLFATDFSQDPIGSFPKGLQYVRGSLEVVSVGGVPMLRASSASEFRIPLGGALPQDFTLEFDLIARDGAGDQVTFEGGPNYGPGPSSALIGWGKVGVTVQGGGVGSSQVRFSSDVEAELVGQRVSVQVMMTGTQFKLFTNGRQNLNIPNLAFRRASVLRIAIGADNDAEYAVYLAGIRLAAGPGAGMASSLSAGAGPPPNVAAVGSNRPATPATTSATTIPTVPARGVTPGGVTRTGTSTSLAPPTALAVNGTPATARLTWQPPTGWTPTGYLVHRLDPGATMPIQLTAAAITTTTFDDLSGFGLGPPLSAQPQIVRFDYTVTALSNNPTASGTATVSFRPPPPQNVSNLIAQQTGPNATISWAKVPGASQYVVSNSFVPGLNQTVPDTQNVVNYQGLAPGTYTWTVGTQYDPGAIRPPTSTWPSVTLDVLDPNPVLADGSFYKEASRPEIYLLLDGNKIHIPTMDALRFMQPPPTKVTTVIDGALGPWKPFEFSAKDYRGNPATPGSLLFPPIATGLTAIKNGIREHFPLSGIAGSTRVITQGIDTYVGEVRGWLRSWGKVNACGEGDVHYSLEVDSEWAIQQGIDLHRLHWVGNVHQGILDPGSRDRAIVSLPQVLVELNAFTWHDVNTDNANRPADWQFLRDCTGEDPSDLKYLPFDPAAPTDSMRPLDVVDENDPPRRGSYVRMVGSLITDFPHLAYPPTSDPWRAAALDWSPGLNEYDPRHLARWVEIHPPDLIDPVTRDPAMRLATMRAMALAAAPGTCEAAILNLAPFEPRTGAVVGWEEIPGPETYFPANAQHSVTVTDLGDHIVVNAMVCGAQSLTGSPGRFKAFYRVWWK